MKRLVLFALLLSASVAAASDHVVPVNNVAAFFAKLPKDATRVIFSAAAVYRCETDIILPDAQLLIIDGAGAKLVLGPNSSGFTRRIADQKDALARVSSRYVIRDFASIEGGKKAIDLKATLGSTVSNLRLVGQTEAAIDLRFALMARVENVLVTNPVKRGIVVRIGDWPGATWSNSQSNHTVLEQCRVYASTTTTQAFTVLHSSGVRLQDCISEGASCEHDLYLSAAIAGKETEVAKNTVVKQFALANFHVEHSARKASIHVNMPPKAVVELRAVYWNGKQTAPVIDHVSGQLRLCDIGWFTEEMRIVTHVSAPRIDIDGCHSALATGGRVGSGGTRAGVLHLKDPLPGNTALNLSQVRITRPSM